MKNFFKNLVENLFGESEIIEYDKEQARNEVLQKRQFSKNNFSLQLKNKLFMEEKEVASVLEIIEKAEEKMDEVQQKTSYKDNTVKMQETEIEVSKIRKQMLKDVEAKIQEIMRKKAKEAKEFFNK